MPGHRGLSWRCGRGTGPSCPCLRSGHSDTAEQPRGGRRCPRPGCTTAVVGFDEVKEPILLHVRPTEGCLSWEPQCVSLWFQRPVSLGEWGQGHPRDGGTLSTCPCPAPQDPQGQTGPGRPGFSIGSSGVLGHRLEAANGAGRGIQREKRKTVQQALKTARGARQP